MYQVEGRNVYTSTLPCGIPMGMIVWKDDKTQMCITRQTCEQKNLFIYNTRCITAEECLHIGDNSDSHYYTYAAIGECVYRDVKYDDGFDEE